MRHSNQPHFVEKFMAFIVRLTGPLKEKVLESIDSSETYREGLSCSSVEHAAPRNSEHVGHPGRSLTKSISSDHFERLRIAHIGGRSERRGRLQSVGEFICGIATSCDRLFH